jgi:hypothetical protein
MTAPAATLLSRGNKMKWLTPFLALVICSILLFSPSSHASDDHNSLETAFNELCGQTEKVEALSAEEITKMIVQCDTLKEKITQSTHPGKKVLLFRLKKCRSFLEFIIQTKQLQPAKQ